jgi:hypothetical protein
LEADGFRITVAPATAWRELGGIGAHRSSQISTASVTAGSSRSWNSRSVPKGPLPREPDLSVARLARRREPALLVVFLVAGQERLGHHPQDPSRLQHRGRVEEPPALQHGQADDDDHRPRLRLAQQPLERALGPGHERRQAEEEVAAGVARDPELGQHQHLRTLGSGLADELERCVDVSLRVGDADRRAGCRHAEEAERSGSHA